MKMIFLILFLSMSPLLGQVTRGLTYKYDMQTVSGGDMTDLSGNGNNGVLHGSTTTQTATGTVFDGSTGYIVPPVTPSNGNWTAIGCGLLSSSNGFIWHSNDAGGDNSIYLGAKVAGSVISDASTATYNYIGVFPSENKCYYAERDQGQIVWGIVDIGVSLSAAVGTIPTLAFTAIGAQAYSGGQNSYLTGTLGYFLLYSVALTSAEIGQEYVSELKPAMAARGVYLRDIANPLYPSRIWQRQGAVFNNAGGGVANGQALYTTTDCQLIANPCFQEWGNSGPINVWYTESPDGINWQASSTVVSGKFQVGVVKSSAYHLYATDSASTHIDHYTGSLPNSFTLTGASVITPGASGQFDHSNVYNPSVMYVPSAGGGPYYMIYVGSGNSSGQGTQYICGGATSPDGQTWTKTGQITAVTDASCDQMRFAFVGGKWYGWASDGKNIYRYTSVNFTGLWQTSSPGSGATGVLALPTFSATALDETAQMDDPCLVEVAGKTYMFYEGDSSGTPLSLKLAIAPMSMLQIVLSGEGQSGDIP